MRKVLIIVAFMFTSVFTFANDVQDFFAQFIDKTVEMEYSNYADSRFISVDGKIKSVSEYGIIFETNKVVMFVNYKFLVAIKLKK